VIRRVACFSVAALLGIASCGGSSGGPAAMADPTAGTIAGTVNGTSWTKLSNAWWAGKMVAGSPPVVLFLFEAPVACSEIVNLNWDKTATGARQILEFGILDMDVRAHQIMTDAFANYLFGNYNPDAYSGTVTITAVNPQANITGSFDLNFLPDTLTGTFDAKWCPDGQEP
jgi:hypothetical protein